MLTALNGDASEYVVLFTDIAIMNAKILDLGSI